MLKSDVLNYPIIEGSVVLKFNGTHGVSDTLQRVLNGVRKVIERVNTPLIALTVMSEMKNAVDSGITHIHIGACHIYFGAESAITVGEFAVFIFSKSSKFSSTVLSR